MYCVQKKLDVRGIEHLDCEKDKSSVSTLQNPKFKLHTTLTLAPNARGGRLERNFDLTTPDEPCGLVTRLHRNLFSPINRKTTARKSD